MCVGVLSACSFSSNLLNSPPLPSLPPSPLRSSLLAVWSVTLLPPPLHLRLQTILEEDLEDPVYQVTLRQITWLPSPAAFLASQLALLCVHCGETLSLLLPPDVHRYYVKSREVGGTKICAVLVLVCLRACLGAWFPQLHVEVSWLLWGRFSDSSSAFQCSSIKKKKCCWNKVLCDFTIFDPFWLFLIFHTSPCHFFSFPLSTADVVVHCVWGGTRAHPWPIRRGHLSGTHKFVLLSACLSLFPRVSAAVPTPPTGSKTFKIFLPTGKNWCLIFLVKLWLQI